MARDQEVVALATELSKILFEEASGQYGPPGAPSLDIQWKEVFDLAAQGIEAAAALDAFPGFGLICKGLAAIIKYQAKNMGGEGKESDVDKLIKALESQVNRVIKGLDNVTAEITRTNFIQVQDRTNHVWIALRAFLKTPNEHYRDDFLDERKKNKPDSTLEDLKTRVVEHPLLENVMASSLNSHAMFDGWSVLIQNACSQLVISQMLYLEIGDISKTLTRKQKEDVVLDLVDTVKAIYKKVDEEKKRIQEIYLNGDKSVRQRVEDICDKNSKESNSTVAGAISKMLHEIYVWDEFQTVVCSPYDQDDGQPFKDTRRRHAVHFRNEKHSLHINAHGSEVYIVRLNDKAKSAELHNRYVKDKYEEGDKNYIQSLSYHDKALSAQLGRAGMCQSFANDVRDHIKNIMDVNAVIVVGHTYFNSLIARWDTDLWSVKNTEKPFWVKWTPNAAQSVTSDDFKTQNVRYFKNRSGGHPLWPCPFVGYCVQVIIVF